MLRNRFMGGMPIRKEVYPYNNRMMPIKDFRRNRMDRNMNQDYNNDFNNQNYSMGATDQRMTQRYDMGSVFPFRVSGEVGRYDGNFDMNYDMGMGYEMPYDGHYNPYYGQPMMPGYKYMDFGGDYGETLNKEELSYLTQKLMRNVEEKDRQFFTKEMISRKAHEIGVNFDKFNEEELLAATLLEYSLHCMTLKPLVGPNMDVFVKMGKDFLTAEMEGVKGGEKLAIYYDCILRGKNG